MTDAAIARAHTNIALVKYWGKRDAARFLPMNSSLSLTLDAFYTETKVTYDAARKADAFTLNAVPQAGPELAKLSAFLEKARALTGETRFASVESVNHVPTAAGLASSASAYAALAAAAVWAAGRELPPEALSRLARQGSGSASRSIFGGFARWARGERPDGEDSHGVPVAGPEAWPDVRMAVAILEPGPKAVASRDGMARTVATSIFYPAWAEAAEHDVAEAEAAIAARDLKALGRIAERSAMRMHATTWGADPPFTYFKPATLALIEAVAEARAAGLAAWATIDAGPNVKALTTAADAPALVERLKAVPGVLRVVLSGPGPGVARLRSIEPAGA